MQGEYKNSRTSYSNWSTLWPNIFSNSLISNCLKLEYGESFIVGVNFWSFVFTRYNNYRFKVWWKLLYKFSYKFHPVYNGKKKGNSLSFDWVITKSPSSDFRHGVYWPHFKNVRRIQLSTTTKVYHRIRPATAWTAKFNKYRGHHGAGMKLKVEGAHRENFLSCASTFLALKAQLFVLVSAFVMVNTVWSVSCLLFYSRCPSAQPFVKVGARAPRAIWSRRWCLGDQIILSLVANLYSLVMTYCGSLYAISNWEKPRSMRTSVLSQTSCNWLRDQ